MKAKIQRSMLLVLFVTILIFYGLFDTGYVSEEPDAAKRRSESGARYIRTAVDISGPAYLKEMDGVDIKPGSRESVRRERCFMIQAMTQKHWKITATSGGKRGACKWNR